MKFSKSVVLSTAVLAVFRLRRADATDAGTTTVYNGTAVNVSCLAAFNEARAAAGLAAFTEGAANYWLTNVEDISKVVCEAIMEEKQVQDSSNFTSTVALAIQDGDNGDCAAAVTHFNGALAKFGSLPPAYNTSTEVYKSLQAVSFVALYNPKDSPKLDCGYFKCQKTVKPPAAALSENQRAGGNAGKEDVTTKNALVCASSPLALVTDQQPFTQKQFDKIKDAINSSSAAVPAFVTFVLAAAGLFLF